MRREKVKKISLKEEKPSEKKKVKYSELYWIIGVMAGILVLLYLTQVIFEESRTFNYNGLVFKKERFENIPVFHYYYFFNNAGETYKYNLFLRNDPRKNEVPVNGKIEYSREKMIYLSINGTGIASCGNSSREIATITSFFVNNGFNLKAGTPDESEASEFNLTHITCEKYPLNDVVLVQKAEETIIKRINSCYIMNVANCGLLDSVEKLEVQSIIDAKNKNLRALS